MFSQTQRIWKNNAPVVLDFSYCYISLFLFPRDLNQVKSLLLSITKLDISTRHSIAQLAPPVAQMMSHPRYLS